MRYLVLLYGDETTQNQPGDPGWEAEMAAYMAFGEIAGDAILAGEALHESTTSRSIRHDGGAVRVTDGPFAETTEVLGGFYVLEAPNLDDVLELVRHIPAVATGAAEVRPLAELADPGPGAGPDGTARYLATIHGTETAAETPGTPGWESGAEAHQRFGQDAGDAIALGIALHPTTTASTVRLRDGELLVTDGPYAEAIEVVGGLYVLRGKPDTITELAAAIPVPEGGGVELRPVMEIDG